MDFFKFIPVTYPTVLEKGDQINGLERTMWVERYFDPGEFSFEAKLSSGLKAFLPLGTLISHADTLDVMIVENHEIKETQDQDPTIIITGRGFESFLENRIVGTNLARSNATKTPYLLPVNYTWTQAVNIINDHVFSPSTSDDGLANIMAQTSIVGTDGTSVARSIEYNDLWTAVREILDVDGLGIRTIRKNPFGVSGTDLQTFLSIYRGIDKSASIFFSWKAGDLKSADYLFTNKSDKNSALVVGQYVVVVVDTGPIQYYRRFMIVDAADIDGHLGAMPSGATLTQVQTAMVTRGQQALAANNQITISQTDLSNTSQYKYRRDYNLGDLVSIDGNFGAIQKMRVVEYAEIEDENGESGHPTLALYGG